MVLENTLSVAHLTPKYVDVDFFFKLMFNSQLPTGNVQAPDGLIVAVILNGQSSLFFH